MSKIPTHHPLALPPKPADSTLSRWLYESIRDAILAGKLPRGARLPSTRSLADSHGISRRIAVDVYEQLRQEGYLSGQVGSGTMVSPKIPDDYQPASVKASVQTERRSFLPAAYSRPAIPFRPIEPAISEFPMETWARCSAKVMRQANVAMLAGGDLAGLPTLREAIAAYLGASRGVSCSPDQILIVSGAQQALDLIARIVMKPGDSVWMEDPAYLGALDAFRNAKAKIVPVHVDEEGLSLADGIRRCPRPRAVYLTPAHQFGLGVTLSLPRRLELLRWAEKSGAVLIEDDYDSEFRFSGRPIPAMRGLQGAENIFHVGTFNKAIFPSLRLGYLLVPQGWMDTFVSLRFQSDRHPPTLSQATLAQFIEEGHFARHLRRMRAIYGERREALQRDAERYLRGALELPEIAAGLYTPAYLCNGMDPEEMVQRGVASKLELWTLARSAIERTDLRGFALGFAAFTPQEIRKGTLALAKLLEAKAA